MHMLERRVQILLDEGRYRKVENEARRRRTSVAAVIRDAIDELPTESDLERRRASLDAILAAEPMPVPSDPGDLRRELDEAHDRVGGR